jgi:hypothetical protein
VDDALARCEALVGEGRYREAITELTELDRARRDPRLESRLLHLRHEAFAHLAVGGGPAEWPRRVEDRFAGVDGCPTVRVGELDADTLASAVTNHGCLLVRDLVDEAGVAEIVAAIDVAFEACDAKQFKDVDEWPGSWFQPFRPLPPYPQPELFHRAWVRHAGGVLAADSPPAFFTMVEQFEAAGLRDVITGYLGEQPAMAVDKVTLRRVPTDLKVGEWHQDGSFLGGGIRTLNVWLALTDCGTGASAPGLDLVPKRFGSLLGTGTDGAFFDWSIGHDLVVRESSDSPIIRPSFRAGDALLFDELLVHRTALDPTNTVERYAIESWFFAASCYPGDSVPIIF